MSVPSIHEIAQQYRPLFEQAKSKAAPPDFPWYPYDTASNFWVFDQLIKAGALSKLLEYADGRPIADIGAADGFAAFFLEKLGCKVEIIDNAPTNFNGLRGARLLKEALQSSAEIHEIDLDQQFHLPRDDYGLVLLLGILYHLKNPFYALEALARSSRYCLLSTRVAKMAGRRDIRIEELPVAYLLDPNEANNDATNFWIFSVAGLKRICHRAGWEMVEFMTLGDTRKSNPSAQNRDERAFCLLRSRNF